MHVQVFKMVARPSIGCQGKIKLAEKNALRYYQYVFGKNRDYFLPTINKVLSIPIQASLITYGNNRTRISCRHC